MILNGIYFSSLKIGPKYNALFWWPVIFKKLLTVEDLYFHLFVIKKIKLDLMLNLDCVADITNIIIIIIIILSNPLIFFYYSGEFCVGLKFIII
jgi:hypothetical protein